MPCSPWSIRRLRLVEVGVAVMSRRDDLAVEVQTGGHRGKLGEEGGHVPSAPTAGGELAVAADEAAEAV
jgi:hypothetical protein